jgi:hypothetical protein
MAKPKRILVSPAQYADIRSLANLTGIDEQEVKDAYMKSFMGDMNVFDILQPYLALAEADRQGWEYTPIFWHRTDDGVLHLTMWDMDKPDPNSWTKP